MKTLFLLGAKDPEMDRIAAVLKQNGHIALSATINGTEVDPSNAYNADPVDRDNCDRLICIECAPRTPPAKADILFIDHHRYGDSGFDKHPCDYWKASSIGQLFTLIGQTPTHKDLVLAAMDHCFPAAMKGKCPEIRPEEVLALKIDEIAKRYGLENDFVLNRIRAFESEIASARTLTIGNDRVTDLTHHNLGPNYSLDHLAAQTAIAKNNAIGMFLNRFENGNERCTIYGDADPKTISGFLSWAADRGYTKDPYGCPVRGYAGAHKWSDQGAPTLALT